MANFHPELYVWLCDNFAKEPEKAKIVQDFLGVTSAMEGRLYPVVAKAYLKTHFFPGMGITSRTPGADATKFAPAIFTELYQMRDMQIRMMDYLGIKFDFKV